MSDLEQFLDANFVVFPLPIPSENYDGKTPQKGPSWLDVIRDPIPREKFQPLIDNPGLKNLAIITGRPSYLCVLDLDRKNVPDNEVQVAMHKVLELFQDTPPPVVVSGSGGLHFYVTYTPLPCSTKLPYNEVFPDEPPSNIVFDFKSDGGFIVAPPSLHESGHNYTFHPSYPLEFPLPPLPSRIFNALNKRKHTKNDWSRFLNTTPEGTRHTNAVKLAGLLLRRFKPSEWEAIAYPLLTLWNKTYASPSLPDTELRQVFTSLAGKESTKGR